MQLGLRPVFCDINLLDFSFNIENAKKIANSENIKMIFVTHLLGYSAEIEKLQEIFPNALIIEDVCESHGCRGPSGSRRGSEYIGGTFSFYFGHHMTTIEGGMVSTNNDELADLMRQKRCHGLARESKNYDKYATENPDIIKSFLFMTDGYNFRNTDFGACLGLIQLKRLNAMVEIRNNNYLMFHNLIAKFEDRLYLPSINDKISSFAFPLICRDSADRPALMLEMEAQGIELRPIVSGNLLRQPFLKKHFGSVKMNNADILHDNGLYISNNHFVGGKELSILESSLNKTFGNRKEI
jgi:CDP-6-deoxy-D-xylo-4-hexulose-3-dehydrase